MDEMLLRDGRVEGTTSLSSRETSGLIVNVLLHWVYGNIFGEELCGWGAILQG
jgi:hypothetical protein